MKVVVWGRNCSACWECKEALRKLGVAFTEGSLNFVLAGTWVGEKRPDTERLMNVAAAYMRHRRMPIVEIDGECVPYPDAMDRVHKVEGS